MKIVFMSGLLKKLILNEHHLIKKERFYMVDNQSNGLEKALGNNTDETELFESQKELVIKSPKPSDPYPHKYYTGDVSMVSDAVSRNNKE
jgi:hypothetical protein